MEFGLKHNTPENARSACQIITVSQVRKLSRSGQRIDKASKGFLTSIIKRGDMEGKLGQTLLLPDVPGIPAQRVLLVGCGKESDMNERNFTKLISSIVSALSASGARDAEFYPGDVALKGRDLAWKIRQATLLMNNSEYQFDQLKSGKTSTSRGLRRLNHNLPRTDASKAKQAISEAQAISAGMSIARDLGNLPANICTPTYIARQARLVAKGEKRLRVNVLDEADMKRLKMGSLLSVSAGSRQPAKLISLEYRGAAAKEQPIALVGKGVTFDTGGISLKPGAAMDEMKFDMCGAASVIGTLKAVTQMQLPINGSPPSRAISSPACQDKPSRFSIPMPRDA
jgi:leucyl aminopeptidase